jgi:O-antigen ligase
LFATYVINNFYAPPDVNGIRAKLAYATSHADSMLFADAFIAVAALFMERKVKGRKWRYLALLPIFLLGMVSNNRRLVWVHLGVSLAVLYLVTHDNPIKRRIRIAALVLTPVVIGYFVMGWNKLYGSFYKPVRILRSVIDAESDASGSSFWRELENFNLVSTLRSHPIFGKGYGHGYDEIIPLPAIDYALELWVPHNSILGLWAYCGLLGYAGTTMLWVGGVYFAMRAYRRSTEPADRVAALVSIIGLLVYVMHSWGDLGLGTWTGVFTAAASLAVASKLGVGQAQPAGQSKPHVVQVSQAPRPKPAATTF